MTQNATPKTTEINKKRMNSDFLRVGVFTTASEFAKVHYRCINVPALGRQHRQWLLDDGHHKIGIISVSSKMETDRESP